MTITFELKVAWKSVAPQNDHEMAIHHNIQYVQQPLKISPSTLSILARFESDSEKLPR